MIQNAAGFLSLIVNIYMDDIVHMDVGTFWGVWIDARMNNGSLYSNMFHEIFMCPVPHCLKVNRENIRALIQYKDVILPVKEIPLWR